MFSVIIRDRHGREVGRRSGFPTRDLALRVATGYVAEVNMQNRMHSVNGITRESGSFGAVKIVHYEITEE